MSQSSSASQPGSTTHDPEEVIRLACPECCGKLNLRRKHVGIAGACVHCRIPVMAVDEEGTVKLVDARVETPAESIEKPAAEGMMQVKSEAPAVPATPAMSTLAHEGAAPSADSPAEAGPIETSPSFPASPAPAPMPAQPAPKESAETPAASASSGSKWGFPDREEASSEDANPPSAAPVVPAAEANPGPEPAAPQESSSFDFSSLAEGTPPPWEDILAGSIPEKNSTEPVEQSVIEVETESKDDLSLNLESPNAAEVETETDETAPGISVDEPISNDEKKEEAPSPPQEEDPFEYNAIPETSALFSSNNEEVGVNSGWGTKVPSQNHASISPFSTGSASPESTADVAPGFAESLFQEKPGSNDSLTTTGEAKSSFGESSANDSGSALASPFAQIGNPSAGDEEVVLDGDGRLMAPMTDEEKDSFAREMMQLGDYHKRSPWVRRIRRFVITVAVLVGGAYAAYLFMPREMVKEYKNKALAFLEPGSVLLDFLPVEIVDDPEGEEGDKMVKVKAVDGLNQLTDQMDGYLNQADQNLRESGAAVEEREKLDKMDQPNMKLPFNVDLDKLQNQVDESAESAQAELDKQL